MSTINLLARNCTLFTTTKALDEDAYRESLQRFVDFKIGPFLASGGSGEANSLSWDEVRRVYQSTSTARLRCTAIGRPTGS